jgi:formate dehydrogenase maturation protein FdhE
MISAWDRRIERAAELAKTCESAAEMLRFYGEIARLQKTVYEEQPADVLPHLPALLSLVKRVGPGPLVRMAEEDIEEGGFFQRCL